MNAKLFKIWSTLALLMLAATPNTAIAFGYPYAYPDYGAYAYNPFEQDEEIDQGENTTPTDKASQELREKLRAIEPIKNGLEMLKQYRDTGRLTPENGDVSKEYFSTISDAPGSITDPYPLLVFVKTQMDLVAERTKKYGLLAGQDEKFVYAHNQYVHIHNLLISSGLILAIARALARKLSNLAEPALIKIKNLLECEGSSTSISTDEKNAIHRFWVKQGHQAPLPVALRSWYSEKERHLLDTLFINFNEAHRVPFMQLRSIIKAVPKDQPDVLHCSEQIMTLKALEQLCKNLFGQNFANPNDRQHRKAAQRKANA